MRTHAESPKWFVKSIIDSRHTLRANGLLEVEDTSVLEVAPLNIIYAPADTEL